jgi:hypothetical protein
MRDRDQKAPPNAQPSRQETAAVSIRLSNRRCGELVHHTCTTTEGQTRSTRGTHGDPEMATDLGKYMNVPVDELERFTFAT